ncbi:MAG: hypothetical protein EOO42_00760 [Flavobacteriales bacterium]|nr:MAG: hypothetical protein EOO42_00760 [Flavobacteriales bacterium]
MNGDKHRLIRQFSSQVGYLKNKPASTTQNSAIYADQKKVVFKDLKMKFLFLNKGYSRTGLAKIAILH